LLLANLNTKTSLKKVIRRKMFAAKALKSYDSCKWFTGNIRNNQGKICLAHARTSNLD
jgi:hypothetical protein